MMINVSAGNFWPLTNTLRGLDEPWEAYCERVRPLLEQALVRLARRSAVWITESMEWVNQIPGWSSLTPARLKALNPSIKVYREYALCARGDWDREDRRQFPITLTDIERYNWWLRDANGERIGEPRGDIWVVGIGGD